MLSLEQSVDRIKELYKDYWDDEYKIDLGIVDHCYEVIGLWRNRKFGDSKEKYENQALDLFVLLMMKLMSVDRGSDLVSLDLKHLNYRISKFFEKAK